MSSEIERAEPGRMRRAAEKAFQAHAATWFMVNVFLCIVWALTGFGYFWPIWPTVGWGLAVAIHGWATYGALRS